MTTSVASSSANRRAPNGRRQWLAWQGFELRVPLDWNVVKLEGDHRQGMVLLADLASPRLGLRWATPKASRSQPVDVVRTAMRGEVGELACSLARRPSAAGDRWTADLLFEEPDPPGRDVWIALGGGTNRLVQLAYHVSRRDGLLAKQIVPSFDEQPASRPARWAVLDISCEVPYEFRLTSHQLSAGDLRLSFEASGRRRVMVRQIGPATLALGRQPLDRWLAGQLSECLKLYRSAASREWDTEVNGRRLIGILSTQIRRRRAFLHRTLPATLTTLALHDTARNRLLLVQASEETLAQEVARSVGWATCVGGDT